MLLFKYTFKQVVNFIKNSKLRCGVELCLTVLWYYDWHFQPELEGFFACLDIWGVFLDYLISKVANARSDKLAEAEATVSRCVKRKAFWKRVQNRKCNTYL